MKIRFGMVLIELGSLGSPIILRSSWFVSSFKDLKHCLKECRENKGDVYLVPWIFACKGKTKMTNKRAEALERARALRARYDSATTVHPSTYTQLADAHELLALHAENENLKAEPIKVEDREVDWAFDILRLEQENEKLTADNAALVKALLDVTEAVNAGECREDEDCDHCHIVHEIILPAVNTRPHPGHALLQRIEKLEAVARAVKGFREHGVAKNGTHATVMFNALEALDVVK